MGSTWLTLRLISTLTCTQPSSVLNSNMRSDMPPRVLGIAGLFQGTTFSLSETSVSIGRDPSNDLWIADQSLSRKHCLLVPQNGQFTIRDLGSKNGTRVNGVPVGEQLLRDGDHISVGNSVFCFQLEEGNLHLERSPVELTDTTQMELSAFLLRSEDALYLQPDKVTAMLPQTARMALDLNVLLKIATRIGGIRDQDSLQWQLLGLIFDVVPAERGAVLLFDGSEEFSSPVAWDRVQGPAHPVRVSRTVLQRIRRDGVGLVVSDVSSDAILARVGTLAESHIHSLLCVPLRVSSTVVGAIYLDSKSPASHFDGNHLQVMTAVAGIASLALENV